MNARINEAFAYLRSGGLGEVEGMARIALDAGSERVACSTDVAIALCMLAEEAIEWPEKHSLRVAELLEANNRYLERARTAEAESARLASVAAWASSPHERWRDISSAPKDGTFFLARAGFYRPAVVAWQTCDGRARFGADPEGFMEEDHFQQYWHECSYEPTHWMPLPAQGEEDGEAIYQHGFREGSEQAAAEITRLRAEVERLSKPGIFWLWEDTEYACEGWKEALGDIGELAGVVRFVTAAPLPDKWGAHRVRTVDEHGDPDETEPVLFDSEAEAEARACWPDSLAAARAARMPAEDRAALEQEGG